MGLLNPPQTDRPTDRPVCWSAYEGKIVFVGMIFSKEMSGSNFSSNDSKISAGMNGSGAKITNILRNEKDC